MLNSRGRALNAKYSDASGSMSAFSSRAVGEDDSLDGVVPGVVFGLDLDLDLGVGSNEGFNEVADEAERARIEYVLYRVDSSIGEKFTTNPAFWMGSRPASCNADRIYAPEIRLHLKTSHPSEWM